MYIGIDQYGNTYKRLGKFPRKDLLEYFGAKKAQKIYRDGPKGEALHVGWIIRGHWISVYKLTPLHAI